MGRVEREPQPTDYPYSVIAKGGAIPPEWKPSDAMNLPINMQGRTGSCGGHAAQYRFVRKLYQKMNQYLPLGPRSAYALDKLVDGLPATQWGTTIQALAKEMVAYGIALEAAFPDDVSLGSQDYGNYSLMSDQVRQDALTRATGEQYFFLGRNPSMDTVKEAIFGHGDVILEVQLGKEWYTAANGKTSWSASDILPLRPPATVLDGHFIYVPCYDQDGLYGPNSWSKAWGNKGWFWMQENYVPYIVDGVVFSKVPTSANVALTAQQFSLATQILNDIRSVLLMMQKEI